jgi:hypothetical protein
MAEQWQDATACARNALTCQFGARGRIRTDDLPITSRAHPSSRFQPRLFWLLTSAGLSSQCVPDLSCYGRGMTKGMTRPTHGASRSRAGVLQVEVALDAVHDLVAEQASQAQ